MIVLGYLSSAKSNVILIPPFHTGHLGLVPDTEVQIYLLAPTTEATESINCELLITPIQRKEGRLCQISCLMDDKPGVVSHLIDAIYGTGLNIISQESSSINHLHHHFVTLLADWSSSPYPTDEKRSLLSTQRRFQDYASLFPIGSLRSVKLFENIVAQCCDVMAWDETASPPVPRLSIRTIGINAREDYKTTAKISRSKDRKFTSEFEIPSNIASQVRQRLGIAGDAPLAYLLLSDTEDRTLRIFFPKPQVVSKTVHVGFHHNDLPGALSAIMSLVARADFNILTSLLRKKTSATNIWEAVLEYRGTRAIPTFDAVDRIRAVIDWVTNVLLSAVEGAEIEQLKRFEIAVSSPDYPKISTPYQIVFEDVLRSRKAKADGVLEDRKTTMELLNDRTQALKAQKEHQLKEFRRRLISVVQENERPIPRVFLSFPRIAAEHGDVLESVLVRDDEFVVDKYQAPRGEVIVSEVLKKIEACDFFIGIWHHDEGGNPHSLSPWMPFEYGIALAYRRECVVVHSNRLHKEVWNRIQPDIAQAGYSDVKFVSDTVPLILDILRQKRADFLGK